MTLDNIEQSNPEQPKDVKDAKDIKDLKASPRTVNATPNNYHLPKFKKISQGNFGQNKSDNILKRNSSTIGHFPYEKKNKLTLPDSHNPKHKSRTKPGFHKSLKSLNSNP
jgi:hypothetical protein